MNIVHKLVFWILFFSTLGAIAFKGLKTEREVIKFKEKSIFEKLNFKSKTIFYIGSSRVMMGINTDLLNDSLTEWKSINIGVPGSSLAQNLYLANFLKNKPGNKVLFIELSRYKKNRLNATATKALGFSNYLDSYNEYIHVNPSVASVVKNWEFSFWEWLNKKQNAIKQLIFPEKKVKYEVIGFNPNNASNYRKTDSFITQKDKLNFANGSIDSEAMGKIHELLTVLVNSKCKVIFLLPMTSLEKSELKFSIPIFEAIPINNKWNYDSSFIQAISHPKYLADKNHLNYQGSVVYTQGLVNYIKANEKNWQ
ncbi:hypothetical protein [Aquirufa ecclesiirivi]|uniref:hypothetical protein n=1 Tax=Aquirufa ecclesiirivi TaxID=2715124 RepID=UPI00140A7F56|nr:hypothetical protein [Aquirufa ecclesiirivi]NHC48168.1 hypothetical protein [Aquirufa ecclesiirivi]